jgi:hypothetical protein
MLFVHKTTYLACSGIRQLVLVGLDTFADIRQPTLPGLDTFADIRHPTLPGLVTFAHIRQRLFEKNVTRLDTFARVIRHFGEFGASGHCLSFCQIKDSFFGRLGKLM